MLVVFVLLYVIFMCCIYSVAYIRCLTGNASATICALWPVVSVSKEVNHEFVSDCFHVCQEKCIFTADG